MRTAAVAFILFQCSLASLGLAQDRHAVLATLTHRATLRVWTRETGRVNGHFAGLTTDTLRIKVGKDTMSLPVDALDTVWVRENAMENGLVVGGLVLGGLSGLTIDGLCHGLAEGPSGSCGGVTAAAFALGAFPGLGIGAIIGSQVPKWKRRYPY